MRRETAEMASEQTVPSEKYPSTNGELTPEARAKRITQDVNALLAEDLPRAQAAILENLSILSQSLRENDPRECGKFLKAMRVLIGDTSLVQKVTDNPWRDATGVMKDSPVWPEVVQIIEKTGDRVSG